MSSTMKSSGNTQAAEFKNLTEAQAVSLAGPLFTDDQKSTGILACVSLAQFLLESGYGKSELAQKANNCFGMKVSLSGNTWPGSTWDEAKEYLKQTQEQKEDGTEYTITAHFRSYDCIEDSVADHSAYLLGAMLGSAKRYAGLDSERDYKKAARIIKDGGYATDTAYMDKLCSIIEKWNLTQYNMTDAGTKYPESITKGYYRVRSVWTDAAGQLGAFRKLSNAKKLVDENPGYYVFANDGTRIYPGYESGSESGGSEEEGGTGTEGSGTGGESGGGSESGGDKGVILYAKLKLLLNIRKAPSLDSDVITTCKKGTIVEAVEVCDGDWYRILCAESETGYAYVSNKDGQYACTGASIYTVKVGDTLWSIAADKLGDSTRYTEIKSLNELTANRVNVGMVLLIP